MDGVNTNPTSAQLIERYCLVFETIGFKILNINSDPDFFSVNVIHMDNLKGKNCVRIEPLLVGSLEMFGRLLLNSNNFHESNSYFLNLHPKQLYSKLYNVEIDYLNPTNEVIFLEASCYDENEILIAKAGTLTLKN